MNLTNKPFTYTTEHFGCTILSEEYIRRFRHAEKFISFCRKCPNYNLTWVCPPFSHDIEKELLQYRHILLLAARITPFLKDIPQTDVNQLINFEKRTLNATLIELERLYNGRALISIGKCDYCPDKSCTRLSGLPCRYPDKMRPSLEAYGFDIGHTVSELFGFELLWSRDESRPDYLTLVGGLVYDNTASVPKHTDAYNMKNKLNYLKTFFPK